MTFIGKQKIRIALLDDHPIVHKGFEIFLQTESEYELVGSFRYSNDLKTYLNREKIDILVLDYVLDDKDIDGLTLIRTLLKRDPELKILMSSSVENIAVIRLALRYGVRGYIGKSHDTSVLINAIKRVAKGHICVPKELEYELSQLSISVVDEYSPESITERLESLSAREAEVLRHFVEGMSVMQIAEKFRRSRKTVSGQKQSAMKKLGIASDAELFMLREFII